jgi:hypothetical protein
MVRFLAFAAAVGLLLLPITVGAQGNIDWKDHPAEFVGKLLNGEEQGTSTFDVIAQNPDIQGGIEEDLWDYGAAIQWPASAETMYISSSDNSDTMDLLVEGLDGTGAEVSETETLAGFTSTVLTQTFWRVHRATIQGGTPPTGNVYVSIDTDAGGDGIPDTLPGDIRAYIAAGTEVTNQGFYTCPLAKTCYAINLHCEGGLSTDDATCFVRTRESASDPWVTSYQNDASTNGDLPATSAVRWSALEDMKLSGVCSGGTARTFDGRALILSYDD